jgi:hypothetical protein
MELHKLDINNRIPTKETIRMGMNMAAGAGKTTFFLLLFLAL